MKRAFLTFLVILFASAGLVAGDIAQFVNLGFSEDSKVFLFGQYGIKRDNSTPFASIYFVDLAKNDFLPSGVFTSDEKDPVAVGQNGSGALYNLLHPANSQISQQKISHTRQGRLVYLYVNGDTPRSRVTFRDFATGTTYDIRMIQDTKGSGAEQSAAFHLEVSATASDTSVQTFTVGIPNFYRPGVSRYLIKQVILSPDEKSLVMVVEKIGDSAEGRSVEYMVETVKVF